MIRFSGDYKRPWLGITTKAREYDKLTHFGASAAGVCLCVALQKWIIGLPDFWVYTIGLQLAQLLVFLVGLCLELYQGAERYYAEADGKVTGDTPDGFSFVDLVADLAGILLAGGVMV